MSEKVVRVYRRGRYHVQRLEAFNLLSGVDWCWETEPVATFHSVENAEEYALELYRKENGVTPYRVVDVGVSNE